MRRWSVVAMALLLVGCASKQVVVVRTQSAEILFSADSTGALTMGEAPSFTEVLGRINPDGSVVLSAVDMAVLYGEPQCYHCVVSGRFAADFADSVLRAVGARDLYFQLGESFREAEFDLPADSLAAFWQVLRESVAGAELFTVRCEAARSQYHTPLK